MVRAAMVPFRLIMFAFCAVQASSMDAISESYPETIEESRNLTSNSLQQLNVSLSFDKMELKNLPEGFVKGEFLTHLDFESNKIESISFMAFRFVPRLSHLNLANNLLRYIDLGKYSMVNSLEILNLNGNCKMEETEKMEVEEPTYYSYRTTTTEHPRVRVTLIPCEVNLSADLPSLTRLYLDSNDLKQLKFDEGTNLPLLRELHLSGNQLIMDNDMMSDLGNFVPSLSDLYLNNCGISQFDTSRLPKVSSLYLDDNRFSSVCNEYCEPMSLKLKGAFDLQTLSVSRNQISKIESDAFNYTTSLVKLDLSHNRISEIREGTFDKLYSLRSLSLENNKLVELNAVNVFRNLIDLESLSMGYNDISNIAREVFENLGTLKTLEMNNNKIADIVVGTFSNLTSLKTLSLAGNQLSELPDGSMPISGSLITLNLNNNEFTNTKHISFTNLQNLLFLYLEDNPLSNITPNWCSVASENFTIILGNSCRNEGSVIQNPNQKSSFNFDFQDPNNYDATTARWRIFHGSSN